MNTSFTSHDYVFLCMYGENIKYLLPSIFCIFQVYNRVLTIVILLYIRSVELIHLITVSLYPVTNTFLYLPSPTSQALASTILRFL